MRASWSLSLPVWLSVLIIIRYTISGHAPVALRALSSRSLSPNSTTSMSQNTDIGSSSRRNDSHIIPSKNATAVSTRSSDIGTCPQRMIDNEECEIFVGDVNIYYWPDPDRDTSCLSIIGNATRPPMQEASTRTIYGPFYNNSLYTTVYWGCTAGDSISGGSYVTTAVLASTGSLSAKQYLFNPWSSQPCSVEAVRPTSSIPQHVKAREPHISAHVRLQPLGDSVAITKNSDLLGATVTSGNFTL